MLKFKFSMGMDWDRISQIIANVCISKLTMLINTLYKTATLIDQWSFQLKIDLIELTIEPSRGFCLSLVANGRERFE